MDGQKVNSQCYNRDILAKGVNSIANARFLKLAGPGIVPKNVKKV